MAKLEVSAIPGKGLKSYNLNIHGRDACDGDTVEISGQTCGDGSPQFVRYKLEGEQDATLALRFRCPHEGKPDHVVLDQTVSIPPEEDVIWFNL